MHANTRHQLLDTAEQLFAERGFYGVSIAAIASEVGVTKQGLLQYLNCKEKLYGTILQRISDDFQDQQIRAQQASIPPLEYLKKFYAGLAKPTETNTRRPRLLMRDLLDNNVRAGKTDKWYLRPFLERLTGMVKARDGLHQLKDEEALVIAFQLLGAVNYYLISPATISGIFGTDYLAEMSARFSFQLNLLVESLTSRSNDD